MIGIQKKMIGIQIFISVLIDGITFLFFISTDPRFRKYFKIERKDIGEKVKLINSRSI